MAIEVDGAPLQFTAQMDTKEVEKEFQKTLKVIKKQNDDFWKDIKKNSSTDTLDTLAKSNAKVFNIDPKAALTIKEATDALDKLSAKAKENAATLATLKTQSADLSNAKSQLGQQFKAGQISAESYNNGLAAIEMQQRQVSNSLLKLNQDIKLNINLEKAAIGSLEEARIKYNQLTQAITKAGGAMDGSNPAVSKMLAEHTKLRAEIDKMEGKLQQYGRHVGNYSSGWNGMQNSIAQLTRELPAITYGFQTFGMAVSNNLPIFADEIKRASDANKTLTAEGKKGVPVWKQLVSGLFSWQTALSIGITLTTVYGKEIGVWVSNLFKGKDALEKLKKEKQEFSKVTLKGAQDAQNEVTSLKSLYKATQDSNLSYSERTKAVKAMQTQYPSYFKNLTNESILAGKAKGAYQELTASIIATAKARAYESKIAEISSKQLENTDKILEKSNSITDSDRKGMQIDRSTIASGGMMMFNTSGSGAYKAIEEINKLNKENAELAKSAERYQKAIDNLVKSNGVSVLTGNYKIENAKKISDKELNEYKSVLEKIADLDREYARIGLSDEDSAVQSIKDKFKDVRAIVDEYNATKPAILIDVKAIDKMEGNFINKYLENEREVKAEEKRRQDQQQYKELLDSLISYEGQRTALIKKYEETRQMLVQNSQDEEVAVLDSQYQEELAALDDTNIQKLQAYKDLFDGIEQLTDARARKVISAGKAMLENTANISPEMRKQIQEQIKQAELSLNDRLPKRTLEVAQGFDQIAQSVSEVNEGLSSMLGGLANILRATVQVSDGIKGLTTGLANYKENKASGGGGLLGSISAIAGVAGPVGQIVGAVSNVVGGVVKMFKASKESARQAAAQIKAYQESILQGELEYNKVLRERARTQSEINDLTNIQIKAQQDLLRQQGATVQNEYQKQLKELQKGGQQITGQKTEKYGGFLGIGRKTRVVDITAGLAGKSFEELERLYTSNKLTEATKKQFEALQALKTEVDDIAGLWDSAQDELVRRMSGGISADSITKQITDGLKNGKRAFEDFGDDIENIIQEALLNGMAYQYLDAPVKALVEQFQKDSLDGLNNSEIENFKNGYEAIMKTASEQIKQVESALGKSIGSGSSGSSLQAESGLTSVTEGSVNQIKGTINNKFKINI